MWTLYSLDTCIISSVPNWTERGASMVGEFLSGGVCQKENGENCSAEATMDGRLTKWKVNVSACTWGGGLGWRFLFKCKSMCLFVNLLNFSTWLGACVCVKGFMFSHISDLPRRDSSHWATNLGDWVVMGLKLTGPTGGFQGAGSYTRGLDSLDFVVSQYQA